MNTIDITYGDNKEPYKLEIPLLIMVQYEIQQLNVIKNFLDGTDSDSWLVETEAQNG